LRSKLAPFEGIEFLLFPFPAVIQIIFVTTGHYFEVVCEVQGLFSALGVSLFISIEDSDLLINLINLVSLILWQTQENQFICVTRTDNYIVIDLMRLAGLAFTNPIHDELDDIEEILGLETSFIHDAALVHEDDILEADSSVATLVDLPDHVLDLKLFLLLVAKVCY